jgi:hypothetical protein
MGSLNKLAAMSERLDRLTARINRKTLVGVTCIRAFLRGEGDPYLAELGPASLDKNPLSIRARLFGQSFDDDQEHDGESS